MKKLAVIIPCVLATFASQAASVNYEQLHKQLGIMDNIIKSSVSSNGSKQQVKLSGIESTYLQGQGVVFTVRSQSNFGHWGSYNFNFVMPPSAPLAPEYVADIEEAVMEASEIANIDVEKEVSKAMEMASRSYERAIEIHHDNRETYRDLRDEQRDLAYELRDIERENRDIHYQMKRADEEDQQELKQELARLDKKKVLVIKSQKEMKQRANQIQGKQKAEQEKREQARTAYYSNLSASIADTLCLYGNGLKALPKGEHVTVILKSGGDKLDRQYQDKIHVFSKRDINGCAIDEIDAKKLLEKSSAYQF